ncbi:acyl-CoA dehydrogenase family protein [Streptomyces griseorubiginosus]|uniref:acyl-CoA dehydrogenase family protein n=1 Tax=Streptomyces griseorubiginosus TaxID=67304 RepID=UPI001AD76908|nr:acyl-CoA dehydrogenase family protein [Streptomyces griseorubiginosus]MBO4254087.1 oxidoreductase [Streptomyces griseorubiginosus]
MSQVREKVHSRGAGTTADPELVARASNLVPLIREHAEESSKQRRIVPEVVDAIQVAGLFGLLVPERLGGLESNMTTLLECVAEIARGDGSTGWAYAIATAASWSFTTFSDMAQQEVFTDTPVRGCGVLGPATKAERVEGGYVVSGRWPYASSSFAASWGQFGLMLEDGDSVTLGQALVPSSAWRIEPTWIVAGMEGTGSDTVVVEDYFVPDHRIQSLRDMNDGNFATSHRADEQNSRILWGAGASLPLACAHLGLARHALEVTLERLPNKTVPYSIHGQAKNSPVHQLAVAEAACRFDQAELLLRRAATSTDQSAADGITPTALERQRTWVDMAVAAQLVREGLDELMTANGSSAFAQSNVLNRIWRDSAVGSRHIIMTPGGQKAAYGALLLGADLPQPF